METGLENVCVYGWTPGGELVRGGRANSSLSLQRPFGSWRCFHNATGLFTIGVVAGITLESSVMDEITPG